MVCSKSEGREGMNKLPMKQIEKRLIAAIKQARDNIRYDDVSLCATDSGFSSIHVVMERTEREIRYIATMQVKAEAT